MKRRVRQTSIDAYYSLDDLGERQRAVFKLLSREDLTNQQISKMLGLQINAVTPRTNELVEMGLSRRREKLFADIQGAR